MFRCVWVLVTAACCLSLIGCSNEPSGAANAAGKAREGTFVHTSSRSGEPSRQSASQAQADASVVAVSGEENDTHSPILADLAAALDRDRFRLRASAGRGPSQDLLDVLHRPDIDFAIVQTDALEALTGRVQAAARERLRYLFRVPNKELHILAPREITGIRQLDGLKVNIGQPGSGTHLTSRLVFERLGVRPEFTTDDQATAHENLRSGKIAAAILLAPRPSGEILAFPSGGRFHLVSIPFDEPVSDYPPGQFTADDYPHLIERGQRVETVAVSRVLAVRDWPEGSLRYGRLERLTKSIYARFDELQQSGRNPRWTEVNLSAEEPRWQRFKAAQNLLDLRARQADEQRAFQRLAAASGMCSLPSTATARENLYDDFAAWRRARDRSAPPRDSGASRM